MASPTVTNPSNTLGAKTLVAAENNVTITGLETFSRAPSAPFAVQAGSATVANLDADTVDGSHASDFSLPSGVIVQFGGSAAPSGWTLCDGTAISRATFAGLFAVLGTTYGVGNGTTTFNVPDLRQRFPMGKAASGTGATLGATGGAIDLAHTHNVGNHTHTYAQVIDHTHGVTVGVTDPGHDHLVHGIPAQSTSGVVGVGPGHNYVWADGSGDYVSPGTAVTGITASGTATSPGGSVGTGTTSSAGATNTTTNSTLNPPFVTVNFIVKN
jgi:microcystin-dependent protein